MTEIQDSLIKTAKNMILKEPFYGLFFVSVDKIFDTRFNFIAAVGRTDIAYRLIINPNLWFELTEDQKLGTIKHEMLHLAFNHLISFDHLTDIKLKMLAADLEVNQYIDSSLLPPDVITLNSFNDLNLPVKAGIIEYYKLLKKAEEEGNENLNNIKNSISQQEANMWTDFNNIPSVEKSLIEKQIEHQLKEVAQSVKSRGLVPAELKGIIDKVVEPERFNWKAYLRRFAANSNKIYTKKVRSKPSKRFEDSPGLKIKKKNHLLVAIDTSGSVSDKELQEFMSEINHIHKLGSEITIIHADAAISYIGKYKPSEKIQIHGRGGTSFTPVVDYYNANINKYDTLIYFTDGEGDTSNDPIRKVLWVITNTQPVERFEFLPGYKIKLEI